MSTPDSDDDYLVVDDQAENFQATQNINEGQEGNDNKGEDEHANEDELANSNQDISLQKNVPDIASPVYFDEMLTRDQGKLIILLMV